jgi:hypothetical protein
MYIYIYIYMYVYIYRRIYVPIFVYVYMSINIFENMFFFLNGGCNPHSHGVAVCRLQPYSICHQGLSGALRSRGPSESLGAWVGSAALRRTNPSLENKAWRLGWVSLLCAELTQASRQVSVKSLRTIGNCAIRLWIRVRGVTDL